MKKIKDMSQVELAAYVQDALQAEGIQVVLSGGSVVSFYSSNKYVSKDLDLINTSFSKRSKIKAVMDRLGFHRDIEGTLPNGLCQRQVVCVLFLE